MCTELHSAAEAPGGPEIGTGHQCILYWAMDGSKQPRDTICDLQRSNSMCRKEKQFDPSLQLIIAAEQDLGPTSFFLEKKYSLKGTKETKN